MYIYKICYGIVAEISYDKPAFELHNIQNVFKCWSSKLIQVNSDTSNYISWIWPNLVHASESVTWLSIGCIAHSYQRWVVNDGSHDNRSGQLCCTQYNFAYSIEKPTFRYTFSLYIISTVNHGNKSLLLMVCKVRNE